MILCIDNKAIKTSPQVQKDVNLEELLTEHIKYYASVEEAFEEDYVPLDFSVSVRSMYSNLVLEIDRDEEEKRYYTNLSNVQPFIHKGYDLIMYLTSIGIMHNVVYRDGFDELMTKHSQFQAIGLLNTGSPFFTNPIIYSHVILSDEGAKELPQYLKENCRLVPIKDIQAKGNLRAFIDTFIEVKEEKKDEQ